MTLMLMPAPCLAGSAEGNCNTCASGLAPSGRKGLHSCDGSQEQMLLTRP